MARFARFDQARFDGTPVMTPQGFLRAPAVLTRTGVVEYTRFDGSVRKELRHPEDVFDKDSLATFPGVPVTDLHHGLVNPTNVTALQRGTVDGSIRVDGDLVRGSVTIQDHDTIQAVKRGDRRELSPGYTIDYDPTEGEFEGTRYDGRQRNITYNHLAIGPRDWAREGSDVSLRLDSIGLAGDELEGAAIARFDSIHSDDLSAVIRDRLSLKGVTLEEAARGVGMERFRLDMILDGFMTPTDDELAKIASFIDEPLERLLNLVPVAERDGLPIENRRDSKTENTMKIMIRLDGHEYAVEVNDALGANLENGIKKLVDGNAELEGKLGKAETRLDGVEKERDELKVKLEKATDPKEAEKAIAEATAFREDAKAVLGDDFDFADKSKVEVMKAAIEKINADARFDGKSDAYIEGQFDALVEAAKAGEGDDTREDGLDAARRAAAGGGGKGKGSREDGKDDPYDSKAAYDRMMARNQELGTAPLTVTRS